MFFRKKQETITRGDWLKIEPYEGDIFVHLSGALNQTFRNDLKAALQPLLKRKVRGTIVLQLSEVHAIDATIAAAVAEFFKDAERRNAPVEIRDASPVVKRVLTDLGLGKLLDKTSDA
jgi:anti-anti-sigma factor